MISIYPSRRVTVITTEITQAVQQIEIITTEIPRTVIVNHRGAARKRNANVNVAPHQVTLLEFLNLYNSFINEYHEIELKF